MPSRPLVSDDQRRARIARRQALSPAYRVTTATAAAEAVVALHATEPASVYLSAFARAELTHADLESTLYAGRSLVKQLAMRRTLFAFPRVLLPAAWGSSSARVAAQSRQVVAATWPAAPSSPTRQRAGHGSTSRFAAVVDHLRRMARPAPPSCGRGCPRCTRVSTSRRAPTWGSIQPVAARLLTTAAAGGEIVRGENAAGWKVTRPRWTATEQWLGEVPSALEPRAGYATLVRAWLRAFGPGTEADIVWWLGSTKGAVRAALSDVEAIEVEVAPSTGGSSTAYLLPDDLGPVDPVAPWAALLPALDPTLMGWKDRDHYLDPAHRPELFDVNGNGGPTAWWDGRVVGGWHQAADGRVVVVPLGRLTCAATTALEVESDRLTAFLDGDVVNTIYQSPLVRRRTSGPTGGDR